MAGAIGVIIGLYIVLWGKAEEYADINLKAKQQYEDAHTLKADSIINCEKVDLEEPLLCNKSCGDSALNE